MSASLLSEWARLLIDTLAQCGVASRWYEARRLGQTGPFRLLQLAADLGADREHHRFSDLAAAVRHADVFDWLLPKLQVAGVADPLTALDQFATEKVPASLDPQRLAMLLAVLHRHAGIAAFDQDVFVNAVGGVRIAEPAADLAVLLAIVSSMRDRPLPRGLVAFGEIGLAGEIRPAPRGQERLREAAKLGFSMAMIPKANAPKQPIEGLEVIAVDRLGPALARLRDGR